MTDNKKKPSPLKKGALKDKRKLLIDAAIELFSTQGFWNTSTASIAKHAKVATGTLFNYFPSKQDLIDGVFTEIEQDLYSQLVVNLDDDFKFELRKLWGCYIHWSLQNPIRHGLLTQLKMSELVSQQLEDEWDDQFDTFTSTVNRELQPGGLLKSMDLAYAMQLINHQLEANIAHSKSQNYDNTQLETHIDLGFVILWKGLSSEV